VSVSVKVRVRVRVRVRARVRARARAGGLLERVASELGLRRPARQHAEPLPG